MKIQLTIRPSFALALALGIAGCSEGSDPGLLTYEEFKAHAYHDPQTDTYVVNGDELVEDEPAMREAHERYLASMARVAEPGYGISQQGLIVNRFGGHDDIWDPATSANLTYCVSQSSFGSRYNQVVNALAAATAEWEATANINFQHVVGSDSSCTNTTSGVVFNVRQVSGTSFLARAFFPNNGRAARELLIDASSFGSISPLTLTGLMRHELGHVLGARHEHTRPEAATCFEDSQWRALTAYDAASVMHYPQCNGANQGDLVLTALDKTGASKLYPATGFAAFLQSYGALRFGLPSQWEAVTGDFDGDGRVDYARAGSTGAFLFFSNGDGSFSAPGFQDYGGQVFGLPSPWQTITGDFNGDGRSDYARLGDTGSFIFFGNANRTFTSVFQFYPGLNFGLPSPWQVVTGDFDNDGKTDYARLGDTGSFIFFGNANRTFTSVSQFYPGLNFGLPSPWQAIAGDFDGDGRTDYARLGDTGSFIYFSNAGRTFTSVSQFYPGLNFGLPSPWQAITGDFNDDGRTDYARLGDTGSHIFFGNANRTFGTAFQFYPGLNFGLPSPWQAITGDFNGDGKSDYARLGDTGAHLFLGNANTTFTPAFQFYSGVNFGLPSPWQVITGDFLGNGKTGYARLGDDGARIFAQP